MLDIEEVLRYCLKNKVSVEQFFILYLLARNDFNLPEKKSLGKSYIHEIGEFSYNAIQDLIKRGFVENFNKDGQFWPELLMLTPVSRKQFADYEMAEELFDNYPITFKLGDKGTRFLARTGGDKDELLTLYLQKINYSVPTHNEAMKQLRRYVEMVERGEVNGHKLSDWIRQEMWKNIAGIHENETGKDYGRDV